MEENIVLGIIGGSGLYQFSALQNVKTVEIKTPFGDPSSPIVIGSLSGKRVAFLARHGIGHFISPTEVNYRANIYALKSLGVQQVVSISACGSLRDDFAPGDIVIPDQLVDFTHNRARSFFGDGMVVHVGVADPFCTELSALLLEAVNEAGAVSHQGGTFITIEGPRFSTKGESNLYRAWGMSIIGMTASPEAFLAREAEMRYATMAHVTDYDVWHLTEETVSADMVVRTLAKNIELVQQAVQILVKKLPHDFTCGCSSALSNAIITQSECIPPETIKKLDLLVKKYIHP
jgi:5'-methylthioadenosine phosphorylase